MKPCQIQISLFYDFIKFLLWKLYFVSNLILFRCIKTTRAVITNNNKKIHKRNETHVFTVHDGTTFKDCLNFVLALLLDRKYKIH